MLQRTTRSNYFIQAGLQIKFTLVLAMIVLLVVSITAFNLYVIADYVIQKSDTLPTIRSLGEFAQGVLSVVGWRIALLGLVCFLIIWIIGIFFSHQFAGPSYKLEKCLREIAQGNLSFDIKLRNGDALHNVADSVNLLVERFRGVIAKSRELGQAMRQHSENKELLDAVAELEDLLAGFQLTKEDSSPEPVPAQPTENQ